MVMLRSIPFESHCEHHLAPIISRAWVAYVPDRRVVGISRLARVVEAYAKRLQIQERLTAQIANTIDQVLSDMQESSIAHRCAEQNAAILAFGHAGPGFPRRGHDVLAVLCKRLAQVWRYSSPVCAALAVPPRS